uniref:Uncharacterized protein n=1 Tax=Ditylenchus dipsaci TaxID=166011 RepID=A0A915D061_9BILA
MVKKRDEWSSKMQFVLTCVGYAVGNVWRFPATASEHGKSAFFIPYTICAIVVGFPVMFFEMTIGQFHQIAANRLFPKYVSFFRGLGWCMAILNTIVGITYNTVIGWCLILFHIGCSTNMSSIPSDCLLNISETPSKQFFFNKILEKSHSISDFSSFNWRMAIAILVSAMGCALINVTGTKSMGKTAYVTATVPYFLIMALLGNSLFIPGGLEGIVSSLQPDFNHLTRMDTWYKAGGQISYSLSLGVANLISFSSCNSKNYNCYSDCLVVSMADFGMSLLGSLTIFSVMGILAFKNNPTGTVFAKPIAEELQRISLWIIALLFVVTFRLDHDTFGVFIVVTMLIHKEIAQVAKKEVAALDGGVLISETNQHGHLMQ